MSTTTSQQIVERPVLFSGPMALAILDGRKTQTRRVIKNVHPAVSAITHRGDGFFGFEGLEAVKIQYAHTFPHDTIRCPYGQPGDRLWVREKFSIWPHSFESVGVVFAAGGKDMIVTFPDKKGMPPLKNQCRKNQKGTQLFRPSIFMPRWASRLNLNVVSVRAERLHSISREDIRAEGIRCFEKTAGQSVYHWYGVREDSLFPSPESAYINLWESVNGVGSWELNPWVWVVEFTPVERE